MGRLGMTGVCGMKKVGHTSFQCLRALLAKKSNLTGATEHGAKNPEIGDILNKVVATKCCVKEGQR